CRFALHLIDLFKRFAKFKDIGTPTCRLPMRGAVEPYHAKSCCDKSLHKSAKLRRASSPAVNNQYIRPVCITPFVRLNRLPHGGKLKRSGKRDGLPFLLRNRIFKRRKENADEITPCQRRRHYFQFREHPSNHPQRKRYFGFLIFTHSGMKLR